MQGPTPSHFPLGPQPSGLLRPGNELAPPPRLIPPPPVTMPTPLGFRASGLTLYWASGPLQHESSPAGHSGLGRSNWTPGNPELGVSPGAGRRTCSLRQLQSGAAWSLSRASHPAAVELNLSCLENGDHPDPEAWRPDVANTVGSVPASCCRPHSCTRLNLALCGGRVGWGPKLQPCRVTLREVMKQIYQAGRLRL